MGDPIHRFLSELKRRHVIRVGCGYGLAALAVVEAANSLFPPLHMPEWTLTLVAVLALVGFPVALVFAWVYDITAKGIRRSTPAAGVAVASGGAGRGVLYIGFGMMLTLVSFGGYAA